MAVRPMIAVTPNYDYSIETASIKNLYNEGVIEAGGIPIIVPYSTNEEVLKAVIAASDGLLVTGGPDVDAKYFGEYNTPVTGSILPGRDILEIFLIKKAMEQRKPVFGICRGIQILNVALGGTLYQDIKCQLSGELVGEHSQKAPRWYPYHDVYIEPGSKVHESFESRSCVKVNTFHHQAVKDVAPGFWVTSRAMDGIIEAIEHLDYEFVVGVQWHPEDMWLKDRIFLNLFNMFIESCKKRKDELMCL